MANIAIIGSRSRQDQSAVERLVESLPADTVIVSGGADGPDLWAEQAADLRGLQTRIFLPNLADVTTRFEATKRYYARNQQIVDAADEIYAFVAPNRRGGTEDTIRRAKRRGIPVNLL